MKEKKQKKSREKDTQRAILDYLQAVRVFHYRNNTGGFTNPKGHFYLFGALGSPDIVAVVRGIYIAIEVKSTGGKQSDHQKAFEENLTKAGGVYILADSIETFLAQFDDLMLAFQRG